MLGPQPDSDTPRRALERKRDATRPHAAVDSLAADQVNGRRADKARDEKALRPQIEVVRRAQLLDLAGAHADDAIRHRGRLDLVVGDQDRRDTELLLERLDLGPHGQTERRVEIGERLVEEQELRLLDKGARRRLPLLLTARELARPPLEKLPDMHEIGGGPDATEGLLARRLLEAEGEQDVVAHGHMRVERVGLENDPDVSVPGLDLVDDMTVEQKLAGGRKIDAGEQEEARRFAAAGRAEKRNELAVLDGQVD